MEKDIGKISKNDATDIVVRIDDFGGRVGLTIREFLTGSNGGYSGFTKAGTRIPAEQFKEFKELINSIKDEDLAAPATLETPEGQPETSEPEKAQETL